MVLMAIEYHLNINDTHGIYSKPTEKKVSLLAINHSTYLMYVNRKELDRKMIKRNPSNMLQHKLVPFVFTRVSRHFYSDFRPWHIAAKVMSMTPMQSSAITIVTTSGR